LNYYPENWQRNEHNAEVDAGQRKMEMQSYNYKAELPLVQDMLYRVSGVLVQRKTRRNGTYHKNITI